MSGGGSASVVDDFYDDTALSNDNSTATSISSSSSQRVQNNNDTKSAIKKAVVELLPRSEASMRTIDFSGQPAALAPRTVHYRIVVLKDSIVVWIGDRSSSFQPLALAMRTNLEDGGDDGMPTVSSLIPDRTRFSQTLGQRIAKQSGLVTYVSYNIQVSPSADADPDDLQSQMLQSELVHAVMSKLIEHSVISKRVTHESSDIDRKMSKNNNKDAVQPTASSKLMANSVKLAAAGPAMQAKTGSAASGPATPAAAVANGK